MSRRKSPLVSALFKLTRASVRQSARIGQSATRHGVKAGGRLAEHQRPRQGQGAQAAGARAGHPRPPSPAWANT
jgi:hypothetical protein